MSIGVGGQLAQGISNGYEIFPPYVNGSKLVQGSAYFESHLMTYVK